MIEVEKALVVCEKHYESHYGEFTDCPYCRAEKAEGAVADLMKLNEELVEILEDESWFEGAKEEVIK